MRKFILVAFFAAFFLVPCLNLLADDDEPKYWKPSDTRFILGAGFTWTNNPELMGGHFEFGIVLYKKLLYIQNNFVLRGGGYSFKETDFTIFTLSDKIIFGRVTDIPLKIYTYLEGGVGLYGNQDKKFLDKPLAITMGFGGGGEISSENFGGLYGEVGYIGQQTNLDYPVSGVIMQIGWRIFF
jgi:hypothetical protein